MKRKWIVVIHAVKSRTYACRIPAELPENFDEVFGALERAHAFVGREFLPHTAEAEAAGNRIASSIENTSQPPAGASRKTKPSAPAMSQKIVTDRETRSRSINQAAVNTVVLRQFFEQRDAVKAFDEARKSYNDLVRRSEMVKAFDEARKSYNDLVRRSETVKAFDEARKTYNELATLRNTIVHSR